jgi:hypothetical protein
MAEVRQDLYASNILVSPEYEVQMQLPVKAIEAGLPVVVLRAGAL